MSYDLIIGANGQDGQILSTIYRKKRRKVILVGRRRPQLVANNELFYEVNLEVGSELKRIILSHSVRNIYYLAAAHTTQSRFVELDTQTVKLINYLVPKTLLEDLSQVQPNINFFYASSKLAFQPINSRYSFTAPRRYDNEYSKWKNKFEIFAETMSGAVKFISIFWLSNHDSRFRPSHFLLPRVASFLAKNILHPNSQPSEQYDVVNDWGNAFEFMDIIYEFQTMTKKNGVHKQFLSNSNHANINTIINEINLYGLEYGNYLNDYKPVFDYDLYVSSSPIDRKPEICTRSVVWDLVQHNLTLLSK